jgi:hypothetical protein
MSGKNGKLKVHQNDEVDPLIKMDGYDDCIIGVARQWGRPAFIVYDSNKVIGKLESQYKKEGSADPNLDAVEWFEFNMVCSWMGEGTPAFTEDRKMYGV